jgi:hypothetical protein
MKDGRRHWLENALLDAARWLLPATRRDWADAMHAEAHYVSPDKRLRWALGCVWTAIKLRFNPMNTGDYRVSRGVMLVEAVGAFGPLTLAWFEITFGASGIVRLTSEVIGEYFLTYPGGSYILVMMFVNGVIGLLGPIGLFLGLRYVITGRGIESRPLGWTLAAASVVVNLVGTIAASFWGPSDFHVPLTFTFLFALLPAAVFLHLMWLGTFGAKGVYLSPGNRIV